MSKKQDKGDLWRKRVMAAVGAWLIHTDKACDADSIKAVAVRASGEKGNFNSIPLSKLRAVYSEFCNKNKVAKNVADMEKE